MPLGCGMLCAWGGPQPLAHASTWRRCPTHLCRYSGSGLPASGPQSAVEIHKAALGDASTSWGVGYKTIFWYTIVPGGAAQKTDIAGDAAAKEALRALAALHSFEAVDRGDLSMAGSLEPGRK